MRRPDADYQPDNAELHVARVLASQKNPRFTTMRPAFGNVPCNGCTLCCETDTIILKPELGDRADQYETQELAPGVLALAKVNGSCVYLGPTGCTIHGQAPFTCREFDCRGLYLSRKDPVIQFHMKNAEQLLGTKYPVLQRGKQLHQRRHEFPLLPRNQLQGVTP